MKKSDLHREWARVLDMCEGTKVSHNDCWKWEGVIQHDEPCLTNKRMSAYQFAVSILEDKPVFVGDKVYSKFDGMELRVYPSGFDWDTVSWNPPKKTFMLNGDELPCPIKAEEGWFIDIKAGSGRDERFYFESHIEIDKVADAIIKLLKESTGNGE